MIIKKSQIKGIRKIIGAIMLLTTVSVAAPNEAIIDSVVIRTLRQLHDGVKVGTMKDPRDKTIYETVQIGRQIWMSENLRFSTNESMSCAEENPEYGFLYTWSDAKKACPSGWRLPSKEDFEMLLDMAGGRFIAGLLLKSKTGWFDGNNGNDYFGFTVVPAGYIEDVYYPEGEKRCVAQKTSGILWSSTDKYVLKLDYKEEALISFITPSEAEKAYSIRCIKK